MHTFFDLLRLEFPHIVDLLMYFTLMWNFPKFPLSIRRIDSFNLHLVSAFVDFCFRFHLTHWLRKRERGVGTQTDRQGEAAAARGASRPSWPLTFEPLARFMGWRPCRLVGHKSCQLLAVSSCSPKQVWTCVVGRHGRLNCNRGVVSLLDEYLRINLNLSPLFLSLSHSFCCRIIAPLAA